MPEKWTRNVKVYCKGLFLAVGVTLLMVLLTDLKGAIGLVFHKL